MQNLQFAQPWWVNFLIAVPIVSFFAFRRGLAITRMQLLISGVFGIAFGFLEAAVVVYLRAATGLVPQPFAVDQQLQFANNLSRQLLSIEACREVATITMLVCVSLLAVKKTRERVALFLWCFAFWDLVYYLGLWFWVRWPMSLTSPDVFFLIPTPWYGQVWFAYLVSGLTIVVILLARRPTAAA